MLLTFSAMQKKFKMSKKWSDLINEEFMNQVYNSIFNIIFYQKIFFS